ncbi:MAG TPA: hypothetical protein VF331_14940 [Polyangiales bacterium]
MRSSKLLSRVLLTTAATLVLYSCALFEPETRTECLKPDCTPIDAGSSGNHPAAGGGGGGGGHAGHDASLADASSHPDAGRDAASSPHDAGHDAATDAGRPDAAPLKCPALPCAPGSVCETSTGQCVQCLSDTDCSVSKPACDSATNTCVGCTNSAKHCGGSSPLCDASKQQCVQCLSDDNCTDPTAARCTAGSCQPCSNNTQCSHLSNLGVCDSSSGSGVCVQCTGSDYSACGMSAGGKKQVCNSTAKTCTTKEEGSAAPCAACVSDAQCGTGTACMQTKLNTTDTGSYCLWKQAATGTGAPNGSCVNVRPYTAAESSWKSVDGKTPAVCRSRSTTCQAMNDFSSKSCSGVDTSGDAECGVTAVDDGYCAPDSGGGFYCTVPCVSYLDCKVTQAGANMECQSQNLGGVFVSVCQFQ